MFNDPLTLAIVSMIIGMVAGAVFAALAVLISSDLHRDNQPIGPTDEEMDQICLWYEAEYGQKGAHEKNDK